MVLHGANHRLNHLNNFNMTQCRVDYRDNRINTDRDHGIDSNRDHTRRISIINIKPWQLRVKDICLPVSLTHVSHIKDQISLKLKNFTFAKVERGGPFNGTISGSIWLWLLQKFRTFFVKSKSKSKKYVPSNNNNNKRIKFFIKTKKLLNPLSRRVSEAGDTQQYTVRTLYCNGLEKERLPPQNAFLILWMLVKKNTNDASCRKGGGAIVKVPSVATTVD